MGSRNNEETMRRRGSFMGMDPFNIETEEKRDLGRDENIGNTHPACHTPASRKRPAVKSVWSTTCAGS